MSSPIQIPKKSLWREQNSPLWCFYCPLCTSTRRVPYHPKPQPRHFAQIGLTAIIFMMTTWKLFEWKGIVAFLPFWVIFETIYRAKVRAALMCPHCGFDPYLYLVDVPKARKEIESHWRKKFAEKGIPYPEKNGGAPPAETSHENTVSPPPEMTQP